MMKQLAIAAAITLAPVAASACPNWQLPEMSNLGTLSSDFLYSPRSYSVVAGGDQSLSNCPVPGTGNVISAPDFQFDFINNGHGRLEIEVAGSCDTVLLVNDASGQWHFNDDFNGLDPAVNIYNPQSGTYDVWVGTYGGSTCSATIEFESWHN